MNDRFKFRVWDNEFKKYRTGLGINNVLVCTYNDDTCVLEQCTGLKDKNGKLIYEGDIVVDEFGDRMLVCWDNKYLQFCFQQDNGWYVHTNAEIEVIGNIHENADLLEIEE